MAYREEMYDVIYLMRLLWIFRAYLVQAKEEGMEWLENSAQRCKPIYVAT